MLKTLLPILSIAVISFIPDRPVNNTVANVNQYQGVYIFTDSQPVSDFEYLGTVKSGNIQMGEDITGRPVAGSICGLTYEQLKSDLIRVAKKKYKDFSGLIINAAGISADVIKFKE